MLASKVSAAAKKCRLQWDLTLWSLVQESNAQPAELTWHRLQLLKLSVHAPLASFCIEIDGHAKARRWGQISPTAKGSSDRQTEGRGCVCRSVCQALRQWVVTVRKRSCGKVMFSQACVCLSACWDTPPGKTPPRQTPPPPVDGYCSRRYASYWDAFLYL